MALNNEQASFLAMPDVGGKIAQKADPLIDPAAARFKSSGISDQTRGLLKQQQQQATQFRAGLPQYQQEQYNSAENLGRRNLASKLKDVKSGASQRGLLFSGLRQGEESKLGSDAASQLANQRSDINLASEDMAQQMENDAIESGMQLHQMEQSQADEEYNRNMAAQQARSQGLGGVFRGMGTNAGGFLSSMGK